MDPDRLAARGPWGAWSAWSAWRLIAALVLALLLLGAVAARRQPPAPEAQPGHGEFPGTRALATLRELVGDGSPHPMGSPANAAVRDRLLASLRSAGYSPVVERGFSCFAVRQSGACGWIENVVARLEGTQSTGTVLLMAHYDSVPAGPGAGDDLSGTAAVLEIARLLKQGPAPRNTILFQINDGEEAQLLGAQWLKEHSPDAAEVRAMINLEARGSSGPSLLFETLGDNTWTVPSYAAGAPHPVTSSVFATIYELLPNYTDLSVFKRQPSPVASLNFAFVGDPTHYHSSADTFDNVSPASLQHHGDNALAAVRGLAQADLAHQPHGRRVFFDVLGAFVVSWPLGWSLWLALLSLALVAAAAVFAVRRGVPGVASAGGVALGFLAFLVTLLLSGAVAYGFSLVANRVPAIWVAQPFPLVAAFWLLPLALAGLVAQGLGRRAGAAGLWAGAWLGWSILGLLLIVALPAPGVSYLFIVPALVAGASGLIAFGRRGSLGLQGAGGTLGVLLTVGVAAVLWFPILLPLYDGLGSGALVPTAVLLALFFTAFAPLFAGAPAWLRRALPATALILSVLLLGLGVTAAPVSRQSPRWQNILLHEDADTGRTRWIVQARHLPQSYRRAASFAKEPEPLYPWSPPTARFSAAPAPPLGAPAPQLTVIEDAVINGTTSAGLRHLRVRVTSPRGADEVTVILPEAARLQSIKVEGVEVPFPKGKPAAVRGWYQQEILTLPREGAELDLVLAGTWPLDWYVLDRTPGLPPSGDALRKARPATAVAFQEGDTTVVSRKFRI
jgi:hypothetical protein